VPDFTISAYQGEDVLGGQTVKFSKLFERGKPVILNFWAGLCPPCRAEMPGFQKVFDQVRDSVVLVGVDLGPFVGLGEHDDARRLLAELGVRYPAAFAVDGTL
jgi:thiol-disulfide isomerase/thioredoxin